MRNLSCQKRRGFTLTEIAIVLGIIGTILGAIWVAASKVYNNQRADKALTLITNVVQGVQSTYAGKGRVDTGSLTALAVNGGWFPADALPSGTACDDGLGTTTSPCPQHPWGNHVSVGGYNIWCSDCGSTNKFNIVVWGLTSSNCPTFMSSIVGRAASTNLVAIYSDAQGWTNVSSATAMSDAHIVGCSGNVILEFTL